MLEDEEWDGMGWDGMDEISFYGRDQCVQISVKC